MNIPNLLTLFRILLVPLFVIFLIYGHTFYALLTFVLAGITDALDGLIARVFNQKTLLGAYLDPIADKLLLSASYIMLAVIGVLPAWLTVLVLSRDIFILIGIAVLFANHRPLEIKPTILGKVSTFIQISTVVVALAIPSLQPVLAPSIYLTTIFTLISGFHYTYIGIRQMGD
ncbi:MAG: CDP-alcohol phosphatidyltransferase family protein [Deltaproteobacteria bacterium]|nr:CDP-alcohol phosphatidyltransferase family protein [Deltaproteobacteria bacterium]